jgi:formate/nitrite transporter
VATVGTLPFDALPPPEMAALAYLGGQYTFGKGAVGAVALATANAKVELEFGQAVALGILCNALVCLAVWLTFSARSTADRILAIVPPITAFVAAGFEHSIANMYFIPLGLFVKAGAPTSFWEDIGRTAADYPGLTWERFLIGNLLPVTIGNVVGGALLVGAVYWFVYLRPKGTPMASIGAAGPPLEAARASADGRG